MEQIKQYSTKEVKELCRTNVDWLANVALPDVFTLKFPPIFKALWALLIAASTKYKDFTKIALGLPRGFSKTAFMKLFCLYIILFTQKKFILIVAANQTKARAFLADVISLLSTFQIIQVFGKWNTTPPSTDTQDLKNFTFLGRNFVIACLGSGGDPRGLNINFRRPDVIICDDAQSRECAFSPAEAESFRGWFFATLMKAKAPDGCLFVYIGNMFPTDGCLLKELRDSPDWLSFITGAILEDGESLWPELHPVTDILNELDSDTRAGNAHIFFSEVLNDSTAMASLDFRPERLLKFTWDNEEPVGKVIIIDPSGDTPTSDLSCISLFEMYDAVPWLMKIKQGKFTPSELIKHALQLALDNNCCAIAVEAYAYQASLLHWFEVTCKQLGIYGIRLLPITRGKKSKNAAILDMIQQLQRGEIGLHPSVMSLVLSDIYRFNPMTKANRDDLLDVCVYAPMVASKYQRDIQTTVLADPTEIVVLELADHTTNCPI